MDLNHAWGRDLVRFSSYLGRTASSFFYGKLEILSRFLGSGILEFDRHRCKQGLICSRVLFVLLPSARFELHEMVLYFSPDLHLCVFPSSRVFHFCPHVDRFDSKDWSSHACLHGWYLLHLKHVASLTWMNSLFNSGPNSPISLALSISIPQLNSFERIIVLNHERIFVS